MNLATLLNNGKISVRSYCVLIRSGYNTTDDIVNFKYKDLRKIRNCGHCSAMEILELITNLEVEQLKNEAQTLQKLNDKVNNSKVANLLSLALNKACSIGELKNCIALTNKILRSARTC